MPIMIIRPENVQIVMMIRYLLRLLNQPGLLLQNKVRVCDLGNKDLFTWMRCFHLVRDKGGMKKKGGKEAERGTKADIMLIHHGVEADLVVIHHGVEADLVVIHHGVEADLVVENHGVEAHLEVAMAGMGIIITVKEVMGFFVYPGLEIGPVCPSLYTYATHSQPFHTSYPRL
jgi:hypothetical protein